MTATLTAAPAFQSAAASECSSEAETFEVTDRPAQILLVDDDDSVRAALAELLRSQGFSVQTARDGVDALRLFSGRTPDLVLLDLNLPGRDGWRIFDQMERRRPFIPCIVITARRDQVSAATFAGVDALMEKPLDLPALLETVDNLLREPYRERVSRISRRTFTARYLPRVRSR